MAEDTASAKLAPAISRTAALLAFAGAATLVVLLAALHFIEGELDPSWHFISEYAIGDYGWMMVVAFLSLALSYVRLFVAIRLQLRTIVGHIGLALLLVSALGLTIAAIFTTDPITVSEDALTTEGTLHNLGGTLGMAMPFAAGLIGWRLARIPAWSSAKGSLLWATGLALVAFVVSFVSIGVMVSQSGGKFCPEVLVGWPNRIEMIAYSVWLMVVAWQAIRVREHNSESYLHGIEGGRFDWKGAVRLGALVWVFPAMIPLYSVVHENMPLMLAAIHAGEWLVKLLLMAVIIGVWRNDGGLKVSR